MLRCSSSRGDGIFHWSAVRERIFSVALCWLSTLRVAMCSGKNRRALAPGECQFSKILTLVGVYRYLLFYKPYDVLSQFTDKDTQDSHVSDSPSHQPPAEQLLTSSRGTLKDYIPVPSVYPVGRLDRDSEGLMLLTNNGRLQHWLSDRRFRHPRTYWIQVERIPDEAALNQLRQGVVIQNYRTRPALVTLLPAEPPLPPRQPPIRFRKTVPSAWLEMTLTEGRNRQVRRMTAAIGFPTLRLVRVAIAHLRLDGLKPGQWRDLTPEELEPLLSAMGH